MSHNTIRLAAAGIAIAAVAVVSLATETTSPNSAQADPSVPAAWDVLHANDGRSTGNVEDKTY